MIIKKEDLQKGQTLLIVVLVMVVALTVGLSVVSRSITDIRSASEDEDSQRAFSAAEAGIEQALQGDGSPISGNFAGNNASYETVVGELGESSEFLLNNGGMVLKDQPVDLWLSTHSEIEAENFSNPWSGDLTVYWGSPDDSCETQEASNTQAALEVVLIRGSKPSPQVSHFVFDPCNARSGGGSGNNFSSPTAGSFNVGGELFAYQVVIPVNSGLIARMIPLYSPAIIGVTGDIALPSQGVLITSTGISGSSQRKVVSYRSNPGLPIELFPYILFAPK